MPPSTDFNDFLHELRSKELERLPGGARTVLHGGSAEAHVYGAQFRVHTLGRVRMRAQHPVEVE